jgi:signal transduction histidine kinase
MRTSLPALTRRRTHPPLAFGILAAVLCIVAETSALLQAAWERERSAQALKASRARIIAAADQARRQIGRDLHDGAQQHLVSIQLELRDIEAVAPPELKPQLARTAHALDETFTELREIFRGLHPPLLAKGGIRPALAALARRCPIIVDLDVATTGRLPEQLELAVYYVAAEALTNAAKHARASMVRIHLSSGSTTHLAVRDDGVGGADPSCGSGLIGLADRVEALGGTLRILSPAGGGTELHAEFPAHGG